MPPRFAYWTIILDNVPTSFRTKDRDEILPLFNQLKARNPGALLKWFSGGRLWDSPEQAREVRDVEKVRRFRDERAKETKEQRELEEREMRAFREKHGRAGDDGGAPSAPPHDPGRPPADGRADRPRDGRERSFSRGKPERRGKDWRPGGEHKDPRDRYKLPPGEARKRWKERNLGPRGPKRDFRSGGASAPPKAGDRPFSDRPRGPKPFGGKPGGDRPFGGKPGGPPSTRDGRERSLRPGKPFGSKPGGGPSASPRPGRPFGQKPFGNRPRGPKPPGGPRRKG